MMWLLDNDAVIALLDMAHVQHVRQCSERSSYAQVDLSQVIGHRQVSDAYLISLVRAHGSQARLATLDEELVQLYPDVADLIG